MRWLIGRIALCIVAFGGALASAQAPPTSLRRTPNPDFIIALASPVIAYAALKYVVGFQARSTYSSSQWTAPSWRSNFLNVRDPLHFVHAASFVLIAVGLGQVFVSLCVCWGAREGAIACLGGATGLLLGVKRREILFPEKYGGEKGDIANIPGSGGLR
jgi:hypothetical protein